MIGLTIGVGTVHEAFARLAARCFGDMTGLETVILGANEFSKSGLRHPAALKLDVFQYTTHDRVVFFDADWLCVRRWEPWTFGGTSLVACRDFILKEDWPDQYNTVGEDYFAREPSLLTQENAASMVRMDYISEVCGVTPITRPPLKWINTGLWVASRNHHANWLETARVYYAGYIGHHPEYYEQPAMNEALERLNVPVLLLARKCNTLVATRIAWPADILGLHVKLKHHPDFVNGVLRGAIQSTMDVRNYFFR